MIDVFLNGKPKQLEGSGNLADALQALTPAAPFAVAINGRFVPRSQYPSVNLKPRDRIDLLTPVAGG